MRGVVALDSGLSTGGFTDCLLQRGAARVYGVDVGFGQVTCDDKVGSRPRRPCEAGLCWPLPAHVPGATIGLRQPLPYTCPPFAFNSCIVLQTAGSGRAATAPQSSLLASGKFGSSPNYNSKSEQI